MRDAVIAPLFFLTAALGSACVDGRTPPDRVDAVPAAVTVTATDFAFDAPDTLQEGWTTFRMVNNGSAIHGAMMARLDYGRTVEEFRDAYAIALENNGPWNTLGLQGGIVGPFPGFGSTNATLYLRPGLYTWYCPLDIGGGAPHVVEHEMTRQFVVTERDAAPSTVAPEATITITMVDFAFLTDTPFTAGHHVIRVENQGPEPHEVVFMKLAPGRTQDDVRTWLADPRTPPPFSEALGGVVIEDAGGEAYFEAELTAGDYVLVCYIAAPDGRPHWEHGMILPVSIG